MIKSFTIFALIISGMLSSALAQSIRDVCHDSNPAQDDAQSLDDVSKAIFRIVAPRHTPAQARVYAEKILEIIENLKRDSQTADNWRENKELILDMGLLVETIKARTIIDSPENGNNLRQQLLTLVSSYSSYNNRVAHKEDYMKSMLGLISSTQVGARLVRCLTEQEDPRFVGYEINYLPSNPPAPGQGTSMQFVGKKDANGNWKKYVNFDLAASPILALHALAHELQHSCGASDHITLGADQSVQGKDIRNQEFLIDEMRAYSAQAQFFLEIAKAAPKLLCSTAVVTVAYGKIPMREFDYVVTNVEKIKDGSFPRHLIEVYLKAGAYKNPAAFFVDTNSRVFRSDFVERVRSHGFEIVDAPGNIKTN